MKLTPGEKLTLLMLADIHKHLEVKGEIDPDFIIDAVNGSSWALSRRYSGLEFEEAAPDVVKETDDILTMWRAIDDTVAKLSQAGRDAMKKEIGSRSLTFQGFDSNNDDHHGVAWFMIEKLGLYQERKPLLNSRSQGPLLLYRRMYPRYSEIGSQQDWKFTKDDLVKILNA